jgi:sarcosine oxidase subunit gamma
MSSLAASLTPGRHGNPAGEPVHLRELALDAVEVTARTGSDAALREACRADLGLELPAMGRVAEAGGLTALGIGPVTWLLLADAAEPAALHRRLHALADAHAAVVETGHGLAFLQLSGPAARHVLAKGCRLDLHPRAFTPGQVARTLIAQVPATLWQIDEVPSFSLAVPVTFAQSFAHFLLAASAECGCIVTPAAPRTDRE